ncbi:MAG: TIGR02444 family protein [Gammaproteobacteria bacterium]|nr:TIGR02444 family protein [Gammaproteobacteria bacterium]MYF00698.1 TIGR02444 family protein [Gammaproteobacteria bacterium]
MLEQTDFPTYSIALYGKGKVEESCLRLQDEYGLDVNTVLFCYWFGAHHGVAGEGLWDRIDEISRHWQGGLIRPLREARRWLKHPGFEPEREQRDLRERIKADEFAAELLQQRMMQEACTGCLDNAPAGTAEAARRNAVALLQRRGIAFDKEIRDLLAAISSAAFN